MNKLKLEKLVKEYFFSLGYKVTHFNDQSVGGFYAFKDLDGVSYEMSADNTIQHTLSRSSHSAVYNDLEICTIQEL